jgi:hypothetical protein
MNRLVAVLIIVTTLYLVVAFEIDAPDFDDQDLDPDFDLDAYEEDQETPNFLFGGNERMLRYTKTCRNGRGCTKKSDCKK